MTETLPGFMKRLEGRHPGYLEANVIDRVVEPERVILFRVP